MPFTGGEDVNGFGTPAQRYSLEGRFGPVYDSATLSSTNSGCFRYLLATVMCSGGMGDFLDSFLAGDGGYRRPVRVREVDLIGKQRTAICDAEHA